MFLEHFGFSSEPFKLTPDPRFFYGSKSHNKAMAYLHYGLRQGDGFIVVTGEIGAGKSMLITHLLDQVDRTNIIAADLITPNLQPNELLSHILSAFRIEPAADGPTAEIEAFEDFLFDQLNRGRRVLLIVDEAQNLPKETLEELRVLSNLDYDGTPLFQVFLIGQPDFKPIIGADGMEQLRQRIIASYHLEPLSEEDVESYIKHRLGVVGWNNNPRIENDAYSVVLEATGGVPRRINKLFNRVLLHCAIEDLDVVTDEVVRTVVNDIADEDVTGREKGIEEAPVKDIDPPLMNGVATEPHDSDVMSGNGAKTDSLEAEEQTNASPPGESDDQPNPLTDREEFSDTTDEIAAANDSGELIAIRDEGRREEADASSEKQNDMPPEALVTSDNTISQGEDKGEVKGGPGGALAVAAGGVLSAFGLAGRKPKAKPGNGLDDELADETSSSSDSAEKSGKENDKSGKVDDNAREVGVESTLLSALSSAQSPVASTPSSEEVLSVFDRIHLSKEQKQNQQNAEPVSDPVEHVEENKTEDDADKTATAEKANGIPKDPESLSEALSNVASAIKQARTGSDLEQEDLSPKQDEKSEDQPAATELSTVSEDAISDVSEPTSEDDETTPVSNLADEVDRDITVDAPQSDDAEVAAGEAPSIDEKIRQALIESVKATEADLQTAYDQIAEVRTKIVDAEKGRKESHDEVSARIKRAEEIISELRDAWK